MLCSINMFLLKFTIHVDEFALDFNTSSCCEEILDLEVQETIHLVLPVELLILNSLLSVYTYCVHYPHSIMSFLPLLGHIH